MEEASLKRIPEECEVKIIKTRTHKKLYIKYSGMEKIINNGKEEYSRLKTILMDLWLYCGMADLGYGFQKIEYRLKLKDDIFFLCGLFEVNLSDFKNLQIGKNDVEKLLFDLKGLLKIVKVTKTWLSDEEILTKIRTTEGLDLHRQADESEVIMIKDDSRKKLYIKHNTEIPALGTYAHSFDSFYESFYRKFRSYCALANGGQNIELLEYRLKVISAQGYICQSFKMNIRQFALLTVSPERLYHDHVKEGYYYPGWRDIADVVEVVDIPLGSF